MVDVRVYVEGPGERGFVQEVLAPHLQQFHVFAQPSYMGHLRKRPCGGIRQWAGEGGAQEELQRALMQASHSYRLYVTTMVDYYALPGDWPNRSSASKAGVLKLNRSSMVESGMLESMRLCLGDDWRISRFVPYVSLHELEALILSKPEALLGEFPSEPKAIQALRDDIASEDPEDVNDSADSAPSKRIEHFLPGYCVRKGTATVNTLRRIDVAHLRVACPHFGRWLCCLESLDKSENTEVG